MKFLMLVCRDESIAFTPQDRSSIGSEVRAGVSEMEQRGVRLKGDVFAPVESSVTVCLRGDEVRIERGPRVERSAPASGFNLLDCKDLDEAIEVSAEHPIARYGVIELRPFADR